MLDKVIQESSIVVIELNLHLPGVGRRAVGEVEDVDIERLLGKRLLALVEDLLGPFAIKGTR